MRRYCRHAGAVGGRTQVPVGVGNKVGKLLEVVRKLPADCDPDVYLNLIVVLSAWRI